MNQKTDQGRATRERLVAVARDLFAERGYEGTSIEAVLEKADVSRGALYHHFQGKEGVFAGVLDDLYNSIDARVAAATAGQQSAAAALRAGSLEWLRIASERSVGRILLIDAPAVLGWRRWREMDEARTLSSIRRALVATAESGELEQEHVDFFAHALLASMNEVALMIAQSEDPASASVSAEDAIGEFFNRVLSRRPA